jgi:hypothetical protein
LVSWHDHPLVGQQRKRRTTGLPEEGRKEGEVGALEPPSHGSPQRPIDRNRRMGAEEVGERRGNTTVVGIRAATAYGTWRPDSWSTGGKESERGARGAQRSERGT